jgi:hypothetical protein
MALHSRQTNRLDVLFVRTTAVLLVLGTLGALASAYEDSKLSIVPDKSKSPSSNDGTANG